ncbi:hypothetical protein [Saccharospirillum mangrovi]|uniref:hypothetical protein n=1 Tax=Saccharospirillum mangrovi TaxID=2161747 RepID=UPI000D36D991|nr:hypothetical protein [Saccharospirillum mangrovi]
MKGYRTGLLAIVLLFVVSPAWSFSFFGLFGSDKKQSTLIDAIPADTAWVSLGKNTTPEAQMLDSWTNTEVMSELPELPDVFSETPGMQVLAWLYEDYANVAQFTGYEGKTGYGALMARYGLDEDGSYAFYLDGTLPVVRFQVSDDAAIEQLITDMAEGSGQQPEIRRVEGVDIRHWQLSAPTAKRRFDFAIAINDHIATATLLTEIDDDTRLGQRFGLIAQEQPLSDSEDWQSLDTEYHFDEFARGYISIAKIAEAILMPQNNRMGRDLQRLAPGPMADLNAKMDNTCPAEWMSLAEQMPRLVYGSEDMKASADNLHQVLRFVLEINNADITSELSQLAGSVPQYSRDASDKIFAFALGLNVEALAPVATTLWTQLRAADFDCPSLVKLQQDVAGFNPAVLGMVGGMAQGLKGAGFALYDLQADASSPVGLSGSALVSISADNPSLLATSLTASFPPLAGLKIPTNGEPVTLPDMGLPQPVQVAIKGKHLLVYTGNAATQAANQMAREPLNTDGNMAFASNYQAIGDAFMAIADTPMSSSLQQLDNMDSCTDFYVGMVQLSRLPMQISYLDQHTERGWEAQVGVDLQPLTDDFIVEPGDYQTDSMSDDCSWFPDAIETLNADGSGQYRQKDANNRCDVYQIDYQWRQEGGRLIQESSTERMRDSCDQTWQSVDAGDYECTVLATFENGFYCLYDFDGEPALMRYRR